MPKAGREMLEAAVPRRPGESVKEYQYRAAKEIPLGYASVVQCWKGNYWSRETVAAIEAKVKNNEYDLSSKTQELIDLAEAAAASAVARGQDRAICDSFRDLVDQVRALHRAVRQPSEGGKAVKTAFALAIVASAFLLAFPAQAQVWPVQWEQGVRYPRPPGGGTKPRPRPQPAPQPQPPPPPPQKPPGYR